jgi:hypothetical protein
MRPANRLETTCEKVKNGAATVFVHTDSDEQGRVVQIALTPKAKTGSEHWALFQKLTVAINRALQGRA